MSVGRGPSPLVIISYCNPDSVVVTNDKGLRVAIFDVDVNGSAFGYLVKNDVNCILPVMSERPFLPHVRATAHWREESLPYNKHNPRISKSIQPESSRCTNHNL